MKKLLAAAVACLAACGNYDMTVPEGTGIEVRRSAVATIYPAWLGSFYGGGYVTRNSDGHVWTVVPGASYVPAGLTQPWTPNPATNDGTMTRLFQDASHTGLVLIQNSNSQASVDFARSQLTGSAWSVLVYSGTPGDYANLTHWTVSALTTPIGNTVIGTDPCGRNRYSVTINGNGLAAFNALPAEAVTFSFTLHSPAYGTAGKCYADDWVRGLTRSYYDLGPLVLNSAGTCTVHGDICPSVQAVGCNASDTAYLPTIDSNWPQGLENTDTSKDYFYFGLSGGGILGVYPTSFTTLTSYFAGPNTNWYIHGKNAFGGCGAGSQPLCQPNSLSTGTTAGTLTRPGGQGTRPFSGTAITGGWSFTGSLFPGCSGKSDSAATIYLQAQ